MGHGGAKGGYRIGRDKPPLHTGFPMACGILAGAGREVLFAAAESGRESKSTVLIDDRHFAEAIYASALPTGSRTVSCTGSRPMMPDRQHVPPLHLLRRDQCPPALR